MNIHCRILIIKEWHNHKNKTTFAFLPQPQHPQLIKYSRRYDDTRVLRIQSNEVVDGGFVAHQIDLFQDSLGDWGRNSDKKR